MNNSLSSYVERLSWIVGLVRQSSDTHHQVSQQPQIPQPPFTVESSWQRATAANLPANASSSRSPSQPAAALDDQQQTMFFLDDSFKCPICQDVFETPKFLTCCGQSICDSCERSICHHSETVWINCPLCNTTRNRGDRLRVNRNLKDAIEAAQTFLRRLDRNELSCGECERKLDLGDVFCCISCDRKRNICSRCAVKKHNSHNVHEVYSTSVGLRSAPVNHEEFDQNKPEDELQLEAAFEKLRLDVIDCGQILMKNVETIIITNMKKLMV